MQDASKSVFLLFAPVNRPLSVDTAP